jgi:hypothetical protein
MLFNRPPVLGRGFFPPPTEQHPGSAVVLTSSLLLRPPNSGSSTVQPERDEGRAAASPARSFLFSARRLLAITMYWLELAPGILIIGVICTIAAVIIWATGKETGDDS